MACKSDQGQQEMLEGELLDARQVFTPDIITQQHSFKMNSFTDAAKLLEEISRCSQIETFGLEV